MMRILASLLLAALTVQEPSGILRIDMVALDRRNMPVTDLRAEDVEVWLSGRRLPIETITAVQPGAGEAAGRLIVLLLDDLTTRPTDVSRVRDAARRVVARARPGDRLGVALLSGGLTAVSPDIARAERQVSAFNQSLGFVPIDRLGGQLLTMIASLARDVSEAPERRKVIVAIGSGWLLDRPIPPPQVAMDVRREWTDAVRAMGRSDVAYYVLDPGGVGANRLAGGDSFAREMGGHAFINTNDVAGAIERIYHETDTYYQIIVNDPPFGRSADLRELDVRSKRDGVTVRARRWLPGTAQDARVPAVSATPH